MITGGRVRLLSSIYDDGEDHHQPGYLAHHGEVLIVKEVRGDVLAVAHEGNPGAFTICPCVRPFSVLQESPAGRRAR